MSADTFFWITRIPINSGNVLGGPALRGELNPWYGLVALPSSDRSAALPTWEYRRKWGYGPSGGLSAILVVLLVLGLFHQVPRGS